MAPALYFHKNTTRIQEGKINLENTIYRVFSNDYIDIVILKSMQYKALFNFNNLSLVVTIIIV